MKKKSKVNTDRGKYIRLAEAQSWSLASFGKDIQCQGLQLSALIESGVQHQEEPNACWKDPMTPPCLSIPSLLPVTMIPSLLFSLCVLTSSSCLLPGSFQITHSVLVFSHGLIPALGAALSAAKLIPLVVWIVNSRKKTIFNPTVQKSVGKQSQWSIFEGETV